MPKSFLLLVMAAGCGLVAMLGLRQMMADDEGNKPKSIKVLIAKADIKPYIPLTEELVEFQERPADQVPIGAVQTFAQYDRRALRQSAVKGEVILTSKLGERGDFDASSEIPKGYRVFTVPITATTSHSGQIRPHDRVDIYVTYSSKDEDPTMRQAVLKTKLILEYVEVFAMGADRYSDSAADDQILAKNASLLVTPEQAGILMMAQEKGRLTLALRPKDDEESVNVDLLTEIDFDRLGTNYSARDELDKALAKQKKELTTKYESEIAGLNQKTAEHIAQTLKDIEQQYLTEQKRRDDLHAKTLAGLESKNVELQTLLQKAINESANKADLLKSLAGLQARNKELQNLLEKAKAEGAAATQNLPEIDPIVFEPKTWSIRVLSGRQEEVKEFTINEGESEDESKEEKSEDSKAVEEETSIKYSPKNENPAERRVNR